MKIIPRRVSWQRTNGFLFRPTINKGLLSLFSLAMLFCAAGARAAVYTVTVGTGTDEGSLPWGIANYAQSGTDQTVIYLTEGLNITMDTQQYISVASLAIVGNDAVINMNDHDRAFFVAGGTVLIESMDIDNGRARGGDGADGGGGGAGLGGAIFVASGVNINGSGVTNPTAVTVTDVFFHDNRASGGAGVISSEAGAGGGGGMGGAGGLGAVSGLADQGAGGGGGFGKGADGAAAVDGTPSNGSTGAFVGGAFAGAGAGNNAVSDGGANGGGGGAVDTSTQTTLGGGGGVGGADGSTNDDGVGGAGGFGGGGGGDGGTFTDGAAGAGGFGGGGGAGEFGGNGGFGGGGGGGGTNGNAGTGGFGGGDGTAGGSVGDDGGGGLGAGGAIFVMLGATLTLNNSLFEGDTVEGGSGVNSGSAVGSGLFLGGDVTFNLSGTTFFNEEIGGGDDVNAMGSLGATGQGKLILTRDNSYTGGTVIAASSTIQVGSGSTTGRLGSGGVQDDGMLIYQRSNDLTESNAISGSGSVQQIGTGTLTLTGGNSYQGGTVIAAGSTLKIGDGGTAGQLGSGGAEDDGALIYHLSSDLTENNALSGTGTLEQRGSGTLTLAADNSSFTGRVTVSAGTLLASGTASLAGRNILDVNSGGVLDLGGNNFITLAVNLDGGTIKNGSLQFIANAFASFGGRVDADITGNGDFAAGSGTTILTGSNSYDGGTEVLPGAILQVGDGGTKGRLGTGGIEDGGTLNYDRSDHLTEDNAITGDGTVAQIGSGTLTLASGSSTFHGTLAVNSAGTLDLDDNTFGFVSGVSLAGGGTIKDGTLNLATGTAISAGGQISAIITGTGGSLVATSGTTILTGSNAYGGGSTVDSGATVQVGDGGSTGQLGDGGVLLNGTLVYDRDDYTETNSLSGTGTLVQNNAGTLTLTADNGMFQGQVSVNAGKLLASGATSLGIDSFTVNAGATLDLGGNDFSTTGVNLAGGTIQAGTLTLFNFSTVTSSGGEIDVEIDGAEGNLAATSGTTILTGGNSYQAGTTIDAGATVQVGNGGSAGQLGSGGVQDDGTLAYDLSSNFTEGNAISGSGALAQIGSGTVTLIGGNTYEGGTVIASGAALQVGNGGTTGQLGTGGVQDGGALAYDLSGSLTDGNIISGSGSLAQIGTGTVALTGANDYQGGTVVAAGATLQVGNGVAAGQLGSGGVQVNGTLSYDLSSTFTENNIISGDGGLEQNGSGVLSLGAINTFTGLVSVNAGTLVASNGSAFANVPTFAVNAGTLDLGGNGFSTTAVSLGGGGNIVDGTLELFGAVTSAGGTISATLNGDNGSLHATGAATYLTANNGYEGGTTIDAGATVQVGNGGTTGQLGSGGVVVAGTLVYDLSSTLTDNNSITGGGGIEVYGGGTVILQGSSTFAGQTTVNLGTLDVNNTLGSSTVEVAIGAHLGGNGTIGGATMLDPDATLTPGFNGTGALTFTGGLTLNNDTNLVFQINSSTSFTSINVIGSMIAYNGSMVIDASSYTATNGDVFRLINLTGGAMENGDFTSVEFDGQALTDLSGIWTGIDNGLVIQFNDATGRLRIGTAPEPSTWALLTLGALGLLALRRRRRVYH